MTRYARPAHYAPTGQFAPGARGLLAVGWRSGARSRTRLWLLRLRGDVEASRSSCRVAGVTNAADSHPRDQRASASSLVSSKDPPDRRATSASRRSAITSGSDSTSSVSSSASRSATARTTTLGRPCLVIHDAAMLGLNTLDDLGQVCLCLRKRQLFAIDMTISVDLLTPSCQRWTGVARAADSRDRGGFHCVSIARTLPSRGCSLTCG